MKLSHRIFLGYFLVVALAGVFLLKSVRDELRPAVRQAMEENMVDTANLLAEIVAKDMQGHPKPSGNFATAVQDFLNRRLDAHIWGLAKNRIAYRIYITDQQGIVVYDSDQGKAIGEDYSQWNDVYQTLQGKYGARSTKANPKDETSSVMYVAAPIMLEGKIIGVLTVSKPNYSVLPFIQLSQRNIAQAGIILLAVALLLGWIISGFLTRSTRRLVSYASEVKQGKKAILPKIAEVELAQLGEAIESMRMALEGKAYVEHYVHTLTHEIKSPLSGIIGACELLSEEMEPEDRKRFIRNIKEDTHRIRYMVDRLLDLAHLESQPSLERQEIVDIARIVADICVACEPLLLKKSLACVINIEAGQYIKGDSFLIRQAIQNLMDNAIDFSPVGGNITLTGKRETQSYVVSIHDQGTGIPDYAREKVFDRFYSLPRPDTGRKSTGLGLAFVKEVMLLHQGEVSIIAHTPGCKVCLVFKI